MTLNKTSILAASLAFALSPALAQGSPTGHGKPEGTNGKGSTQRSETGAQHTGGAENHGKGSHREGHHSQSRCAPHDVAYLASGTLVSDTLTKSESANTYSGQITVEVTHANHHARAALGEAETYTLQEARVRGPIPVEDLAPGDRVKVIGKVTAIAPKCETSTFAPTTTVTKVVVHAPIEATASTPTS